MAEARAAGQVRRWSCSCSIAQAAHWLDLHTQHALTEGGEVAALLGEVVSHFLSTVRRGAW